MARGRVVRKSSFAAGTERGLINIRWRAVIAGGYIYMYILWRNVAVGMWLFSTVDRGNTF